MKITGLRGRFAAGCRMLLIACFCILMCLAVFAEEKTPRPEEFAEKIRDKLKEFGWRVRNYKSDDTDIWGNQGVGVGGYIVGSSPETVESQPTAAPQMLSETELKTLKKEISQSMETVQFQKEQREELEYYLSQIESQLASYKENFEIRGGTTYVVKRDDSLWRIARAEYGDANKWPLIYRANQDKIRNPNLIRPGLVLQLPQLKIRK